MFRLHDVFVERAHTHVHTGLDNAETTANTLVLTAEDVEAFCLAINRRCLNHLVSLTQALSLTHTPCFLIVKANLV